MSTVSGTAKWVGSTSVRLIVLFGLLGFLVAIFASPALLVVPAVYNPAGPYIWLALLATVIGIIGNAVRTQSPGAAFEKWAELEGQERLVYALDISVLASGMVSAQIALIGMAAAGISLVLDAPLLGFVVAAFYPYVDGYLGRHYGLTLGLVGFHTARIVITGTSTVSGLSRHAAEAAILDFRELNFPSRAGFQTSS